MKLYLDTSTFGGFFDKEFKEETRKMFSYIAQEDITILVSDLIEDELLDAPEKVRSIRKDLKNTYHTELNKEALDLADTYIKAGALGKKSINDAYHIAMATVAAADAIVSWNFKHIANFVKSKQYNDINVSKGYGALTICSPYDMVRSIENLQNQVKKSN